MAQSAVKLKSDHPEHFQHNIRRKQVFSNHPVFTQNKSSLTFKRKLKSYSSETSNNHRDHPIVTTKLLNLAQANPR